VVTNRSCDLPVEKTRDASNRYLPPKRTTCTRTSRVPSSLSQLSLRGRPTETKAPCGMTGGPDVSRRPKTASADRRPTLISSSTASRPGDTSVGVFFPRCWLRSSLWHPCRDSAITLAPHSLSRALQHLAVRPSFGRVGTGRRMGKTAETTVDACSWKPTPRDDPGCLLSVRTLRRIRWPLRSRSRDLRTAFGDVETAGWQSLVTLGLAPVLARLGGESDSRRNNSLDPPADGFTRRPVLRARPPFTRPCRSFWSAFAELIRDQSSPTDFCNCTTTCGQPNPGSSWSSQGGRPRSPSFSSTCHALSLAGAVTRGEPHNVQWRRPQCWFFSLTRACPTVIPPSPPHLRSLRCEHSEDRRARVRGPSEGRVPRRMRRSLVPASGACA